MGKGKGKFLRYAVVLPKNCAILELSGWHILLIRRISFKFSKKINVPLNIFLSKTINVLYKGCTVNKNYSYQLIKKHFNVSFV